MKHRMFVATAVAVCLLLAMGANAIARDSSADTGAVSVAPRLDARGVSAEQQAAHAKVASLLEQISQAPDDERVELWLQQALSIDLSDHPRALKLRFQLYNEAARVFEYDNARRAHYLAKAAEVARRPATRADLEAEVELLGGDPARAVRVSRGIEKTVGVADTCDTAIDPGDLTAAGDALAANVTIPNGDRDFYTIDVNTGTPGVGVQVRIETISDQIGVPPPAGDDTRLWLYNGCDGGTGNGTGLFAFNDQKNQAECEGGAAFCFTSKIQTACLLSGTYYLQIDTFPGFKADNVDVEIEATGNCTVTIADTFEPDAVRDDAPSVQTDGTPLDRSIFPSGDEDLASFPVAASATGGRLVRIKADCEGADCSNPSFDTVVDLLYASENVPVNGLCNQQVSPLVLNGRTANACNNDLDCDFDQDGMVFPADLDDLTNPVDGLPACVTWNFFQDPPVDSVDNPLASNDDGPNAPGSELVLCLPQTDMSPSSSVAGDPSQPFEFFVRTRAFAGGEFDYVLRVEDLGPCAFESEPNNDPATANPGLPGSISGIFDYSANSPGGDHDFYQLDIQAPQALLIQTSGFDPNVVDTFIDVLIGPDGNGDFTSVISDEDSGAGLTSSLIVALAPACEVLGGCSPATTGGPGYVVDVTSSFAGPNFPYTVSTAPAGFVNDAAADTTDCGQPGAGEFAAVPAAARGVSEGSCDRDGYRFHLPTNTFVTVRTANPTGYVDTAIMVVDCSTDARRGCNDDNPAAPRCSTGYCSQLSGCLAGGRDYCVRVRPWSGSSVFDYELEVVTTPGACTPVATMTGNSTAGNCTTTGGFETSTGCTAGAGNTCFDPSCGDGLINLPGEVCDDGNNVNGDGCDNNCTVSACGNGVVGGAEECEDGNFDDGDGCDSNCTFTACGNGIVTAGEECDDGNLILGDGCDAACVVEDPLSVQLESFTATATPQGVLIQWTTTLERDNAGFRILRGAGEREKGLTLLTPRPIPAAGTELSGSSYQFLDSSRLTGTVLYYLEDVDVFGRTRRHGPVSVTITPTRTGR